MSSSSSTSSSPSSSSLSSSPSQLDSQSLSAAVALTPSSSSSSSSTIISDSPSASSSWWGSFTQSVRELWIPTNHTLLQRAERQLLQTMSSPFRQHRVPVDMSEFYPRRNSAIEYVNTVTLRQRNRTTSSTNNNSLTTTTPIEPTSTDRHLVLIHGYGAGVGLWVLNADALASSFGGSVHMIDMLGMGNSSRPNFIATNTDDAERFFVHSMEEWRQKMNIHKFTLCGHSFGGYMSALYALQYPQHVERLILVSPVGVPTRPAGGGWESKLEGTRKFVYNTFAFLWRQGVTPQSIVRTLGPFGRSQVNKYVNNRFLSPEEDSQAEGMFMNKALTSEYLYHITAAKGSSEFALNLILAPGAWAYRPLHNRLEGLSSSIPLHMIYGSHDWMDPRAGLKTVDHLRSHGHARSSFAVIDGAGHQVSVDQPARFAAEMSNIFSTPL